MAYNYHYTLLAYNKAKIVFQGIITGSAAYTTNFNLSRAASY
jgi:hypothetical protein